MFWSIVLAGVLLLVLWSYLRDDASHPLWRLPGPPMKPVIGNVLEFTRLSPEGLFIKTRELATRYGDRCVVKVFRRWILHTTKPDDVEMILSHTKNISKSKPYSFLQPWLGTGLLLSTGSKWHKRRKILTPTFHFNILKNFTTVMEEKSLNLVHQLQQTGGQEQNIFPLISDVTLYAICETAMGTQLDRDQSAATVEYKQAILNIGGMLLGRLTRFWLHSDFIFNNSSIGKQFLKYLKTAHSFADGVILERKRQKEEEGDSPDAEDGVGSKRRMAMLDLLLEAESKGEIDLEGIREEVNTFMFEGHDTTATALTFGIMLLADHEDVQARVFEEIQNVLGDRTPTMTDLGDLKYLEAVIKETLRLYPSVPFIAREISEEFVMGDIVVPKGVEVAVHIYDLHRRADVYSEPEAFRPDRFLDGSQRHPYGYVPFSAGSRNCIGQRFAMLEMKSILCEVCRSFKLEPRVKGWRPRLIADMVLRSGEPIYVKFVPRAEGVSKVT